MEQSSAEPSEPTYNLQGELYYADDLPRIGISPEEDVALAEMRSTNPPKYF